VSRGGKLDTNFVLTGSLLVNYKGVEAMGEEVFLTREGMEKLKAELHHLKTVRRKEVADRIKEAREYGDIIENSEYDDAKNEQAFVEGRIKDLEQLLRNVKIIEDDEGEEKGGNAEVKIGSTVELKDLESEDFFVYTVVGSAEADPSENKISNESPVGKAILGKKVGEKVTVEVPAGTIDYEIVSIRKKNRQ